MKRNLKTIVSLNSYILYVVMIGLSIPLAFAEEVASQENIWERTYLTGNWGGKRSSLVDNGVEIRPEYTSFYQDLASGNGEDNGGYSGKVDAFINLDSEKLGLWEGGGIAAHLEYRHGAAESMLGGAVFPVNTAIATVPSHQLEVTSLHLTQKIGDYTTVLLGKINALDFTASDPFFGGLGIDRFMNLAFVIPPSGVFPPVIIGTVVNIDTQPVSWSIMLFDPNNHTTDYIPKDLFTEGFNVSIGGKYTSTLSGRKTSYKLTGTYSTKHRNDLETLYPGLETTEKDGSYNINFIFSHDLQENGDLGVYLKTAIADGNPNPIKSSVVGGVSGKASFFNRAQDMFGIGAYYYNYSDELHDVLEPSLIFKDEAGIEAFYNYALTPWIHITGDIQYINPSTGESNVLTLALRANIKF